MMVEVTVDGCNVVGPVTVDQVRRGLAAGMIPANAHARPAGSTSWTPLAVFLTDEEATPDPRWQDDRLPRAGHQLALLQQQIRQAEERLATLLEELESAEEAIEMQSFGFHEPRYRFETSPEYLDELDNVREKQKHAVKEGKAISCEWKWPVDRSSEEDRKLVAQLSKLMLRAFNVECDAAIAKVRYGNAVVVERRMNKSFRDINNVGESKKIALTEDYYDLKLDELHLVHDHRHKIHEEKARIRERMRDEQKALQEIERAPQEAQSEGVRYSMAVKKTRPDLAESGGRQNDRPGSGYQTRERARG